MNLTVQRSFLWRQLISEAKRPVILAGAGAVRGHAAAAVTELADRLHIPVVNTMMAKGIIPMDDKYSLWTIGIPQKDYVNQLFDRADLIIAIGYDIVECAPAKWGARADQTILHIDTAPADVNKRYQPAVEVVGDISESLYEILRCARRRHRVCQTMRGLSGRSRHPSATSSTIITLKPTAKNTVPTLECCPCDISVISSSTTTYSMAPAAKLSR